jgi:cellulose synthase/poly-beta-1,6-N-acetylglucosamine synthase-like glycosyltransferase
MLGNLLESLARLDYPHDRYTVYVIADNCTDNTATVASATGWVRVCERFDETKRGKGYALNWMFNKLEAEHEIYDAYVILDSDSVVEPAYLQALERELARGTQAIHSRNVVMDPTISPSTALRWIALTLIAHVRPLGRNAIGGSSTIGNGMCLSRVIVERYPWNAFTLTEDYEYYLTLVQNGVRIRYVPEAVIHTHMPATFAQMRTQDIRWESSAGQPSAWKTAWQLLRNGVRSRDFMRLEAIAELLTPPLSFLVSLILLSLVLSLLTLFLLGMLISLALLAGLIFYVGTAFYLLRPPGSVYLAFLRAPGFMLWKIWVYLVLSRSKKHTKEWVRTSRVTSPGQP